MVCAAELCSATMVCQTHWGELGASLCVQNRQVPQDSASQPAQLTKEECLEEHRWGPAQGHTVPEGFHLSTGGSSIRKRPDQGAKRSELVRSACCLFPTEHSLFTHKVAMFTPQRHYLSSCNRKQTIHKPRGSLDINYPQTR